MNRFWKALLAGSLASCAGVAVFAAAPEAASDFEKIRQAERFTIGGVGIAGTRSPAELALEALLKEPAAADQCRQLVGKGSMAGQLYGLLGLKRSDPEGFKELVPAYKASKESVPTASGCMLMSIEVATVARKIEDGDYK